MSGSLDTTPALPAPEGYVVDFDNPQRHGIPFIYWVEGIGLTLSTAALAMRVYTKARIVRDFKAEDWCVVWSFAFSVAVQSIIMHTFVSKSGAVHAWEESISTYNYELALVITSAVLYTPCLALAKFSLLLFFYRMSHMRWLRIFCAVLGAAILGYSIAGICALIFPCRPVAKAWDITITEGSCISRASVYIMQCVTNIVSDIILLIMPIPIVWKLHMPIAQKIGVVLIFVVGSLTCVTSVVRLVLLLPTLTDPDFPWAIAIPSVWVLIEANLVILCCSLPALRLFLRHFAPKFMSEFSMNRTHTDRYGPGEDTHNLKSNPRANSTYGKIDILDAEPAIDLDSFSSSKGWSECRYESIHPLNAHPEKPVPPQPVHVQERNAKIITRTESFSVLSESRIK